MKEKCHGKGMRESDLDPIPGQEKTWERLSGHYQGVDNSLFPPPLPVLHVPTLFISTNPQVLL